MGVYGTLRNTGGATGLLEERYVFIRIDRDIVKAPVIRDQLIECNKGWIMRHLGNVSAFYQGIEEALGPWQAWGELSNDDGFEPSIANKRRQFR